MLPDLGQDGAGGAGPHVVELPEQRLLDLPIARPEALGPVGVPPRDRRAHRQERPLRQRELQRRADVVAGQALVVDLDVAGAVVADDAGVLAAGGEVERQRPELGQGAVVLDARPAADRLRVDVAVEDLVDAVGPADRVAPAERARHVALVVAGAQRRVVEVHLVLLLDRHVAEVVDGAPGLEPAGETLHHVGADLEALAGRLGDLRAALLERARALVEAIHAELAVRPRRRDVAVLAAVALAGPGEPVVHHGQILAPVDGPEEGVAERRAADGRRAVDRQQEAGRAVLLVDRVVHRRDVEQRHVLDLEDGVLQHGALVDGQRDRAGGDFPARRRLDAGRERALVDAVPVHADLLDRLAVEERVGLLAAEEALVDLVADRRRAEGVEERPRARPGVEVGLVGGDPARRRDEHHVADGDQAVLVVVVVGDVGREADALGHQLDLDRARVADVVEAETFLAGGGAETDVGRRRAPRAPGRRRPARPRGRRGARRARARARGNQRARRRRIALPCGSAPRFERVRPGRSASDGPASNGSGRPRSG